MKSKRDKLPNRVDNNPADIRQVKYAKSLGILLPEGATKSDGEALINRELDSDVEASSALIEYAHQNKILCSHYIGNKQLHTLLFDHLEESEKAAFFCFCIYKFYFQDKNENLNNHPHKGLFKEFGQQYGSDFYVKTSIEEYVGEEIIAFGKSTRTLANGKKQTLYGGSIHTKAYKVAYDYLETHLGALPKLNG